MSFLFRWPDQRLLGPHCIFSVYILIIFGHSFIIDICISRFGPRYPCTLLVHIPLSTNSDLRSQILRLDRYTHLYQHYPSNIPHAAACALIQPDSKGFTILEGPWPGVVDISQQPYSEQQKHEIKQVSTPSSAIRPVSSSRPDHPHLR